MTCCCIAVLLVVASFFQQWGQGVQSGKETEGRVYSRAVGTWNKLNICKHVLVVIKVPNKGRHDERQKDSNDLFF